MEKHTAIYLRVSTRSQGTESQLPDLKRFAASVEGPVTWYEDKFSGKSMDRPGWNRLARAIAAGEVRQVAVWRLDRLGRSARGLSALFADLAERKVGLVSLREGIDLNTPAGKLMAHVLASVAQYETEVRSERQIAGIAAAKERGVRFGRRPGEGGRPGKPLKVTREQEELIRAWKAEGRAIAAIARATALSRPTIYAVLGAAPAD